MSAAPAPAATMRRAGAAGLLLAMCLALSACLLSPGKFASTLDIRRDGSFAFTYTGEIHLLALSKLASMGRGSAVFTPSTCIKESTGEERSCSEAEIATQRERWEELQAEGGENRRRENAQLQAMLGGIDPASPQAAEELAARLRRQAGWRRVEHKGDGLFDVDFAITGRLNHDFAFPTIERFPFVNDFVQVSLRNDGTIRIDAPGFGTPAMGDPLRGMMQAGAMAKADGENAPAAMPMPDGTFTLTTDGAIMANNTDDGPQPWTSGQSLSWPVNLRSAAAPMALIRIGQPGSN